MGARRAAASSRWQDRELLDNPPLPKLAARNVDHQRFGSVWCITSAGHRKRSASLRLLCAQVLRARDRWGLFPGKVGAPPPAAKQTRGKVHETCARVPHAAGSGAARRSMGRGAGALLRHSAWEGGELTR